MAASVAYPVASLLEDELRKPRTPRLTTGSDNWTTGDTHDVCDLEFMLACIQMEYAISNRDSERPAIKLAENMRTTQEFLHEKSLRLQPILHIGPPPPPYEGTTTDLPPDYTATETLATSQTHTIDLPPKYVPSLPRRTNEIFISDPLLNPRVDFSSLHNVRAHAKKSKAKKAAPAWEEKKEEPKEEEKADGEDKDGADGGSGGAGGNGGDDGDGNGGEDWNNDWDSGKKKKGKKNKKQEEEEERKKEEEEAKKKEEEEAAGAKDEWGAAGGDDEWGAFSSSKKGKKAKQKVDDKPAEEVAAEASTSIWADTAGGDDGGDNDGFGFLTGKKGKKGKKAKAPAEDSTPAATTESFQEISLNDGDDLGVPKISLSFEDSTTTKKEESSGGFGIGGWGTSWSFGGVGGKKEEEKPKSPSFWKKSTFSDFNFGFGGASGDSKDDSKKDDEDDDNLLPSWGTAGIGNSTKKDKKISMFGIEEVDDTLPDAKSNGDTWGGWSSDKKKKEDEKKPATKSWDTWGSTTTTDKKKKSWADLDEEDEEEVKLDPLPVVKEDDDAGWGSFSTANAKSKTKKKGKAGIEETPEPASKDVAPAKDDIWGWTAKDSKGKKDDKKDDDGWGEFASTTKDKKSKGDDSDETAGDGSPPLSILKGLPVLADGKIENLLGDVVGELVEDDMVHAKKCFRMMYLCDDEGNVKNSKGKVIAKAKTIAPEKEPEPEPELETETTPEALAEEAEPETTETPDISILDGLKVEADGKILDLDGNPVGELIDGDAKAINKKRFTCNTRGEIRDKKWKVIGQAQVLPAASKTPAKEEPEAEKPIEEEEKPAEEEPEAELPDISTLKGLKLEPDGKLLNEDGVAIGEIVDCDDTMIATIVRRKYTCSAEGTFTDKKMKIVGRCKVLPAPKADTPKDEPEVETKEPEPAAELEKTFETPDISILQGLAVEKDGKIYNLERVAIGELVEGDAKVIAKKMTLCNAEGQFKDKKKILGKAQVLPQEVTKAPDPPAEEEAAKVEEADEGESINAPPVSILDNLCIETDGTILNLDRVVVGKVVEGDAKKFASMMYFCDGEGNVVNYTGKAVGKVETVAPPGSAPKEKSKKKSKDQPAEETKEDKPKDEPEAKEEAPTAEPPPLSILKGRFIEADGTILNDDGDVIGEVTDGDPERFNSISAKCDGEGNVIGSKKKKVGKVKTVVPGSQPAADEATGEDDTAAEAVEEAPEETKPEEVEEPVSLEILKGRTIELSGDIFDDDFKIIGRLIEGDAKKLNKGKAKCDSEGNVIMKNKQVGKVEVIQPEKPEVPETPAEEEKEEEAKEEEPAAEIPAEADQEPIPLSILKGCTIAASGDVVDADFNVVGTLIDGNAKKLNKGMAKCDGEGNVTLKGKIVGKVEVIQPEKPEQPAEEEKEETKDEEPAPSTEAPAAPSLLTLAILDGKYIDEYGDFYDDDGVLIGRLIEGSGNVKRLHRNFAQADHEGNLWQGDKKAVGKVELVLPEKTEEETPPPPAPEKTKAPAVKVITLEDLEGRTIELNGDVLDDNLQVIGKLVKGKADKLHKVMATCDDNGGVYYGMKKVGNVEAVQPEAKKEEAEEEVIPAPPAEDEAEPEPEKPEPPTFAILDGRKIEKSGEVFDDDGNVIARLTQGSGPKLFKTGATCHADGTIWAKNKQVKDAALELVLPEVPEAVPEISLPPRPPPPPAPVEEEPPKIEPPSFAILAGIKPDKFGEFYNDDNVLIAKIVEGSISKLFKAGATCDAEGKVWAKGKLDKLAKVELVFQDEEPEAPTPPSPPPPPPPPPPVEAEPEPEREPAKCKASRFAKAEGMRIDKFGEIRTKNYDLVAKLVKGTGDAKKLAKDKAVCDAEGNLLVNGKVVKDARIEMEGAEEEEEEEKEKGDIPEPEPEPEKEAEKEPEPPKKPDFSKAEGLSIDRFGDIMDKNWNLVARLVEGDPKKLSKDKAVCDANGNVLVKKKIVPGAKIKMEGAEEEEPPKEEEPPVVEDPPVVEEPPAKEPEIEVEKPKQSKFAKVDGLAIDRFGDIWDTNYNLIAKLVEGDAAKLSRRGATCDADGNVISKGKVVSGARIEMEEQEDEPAAPEPEPEPIEETKVEENKFAKLLGLKLDKQGEIWDKQWNLLARLVEGNVNKLVKDKAVCDDQGNLLVKGKVVEGAKLKLEGQDEAEPELAAEKEEEEEEEKEAAPEPPSLTLAALEGRTFEKDGTILNDDGKVIGKLVEGLPKLAAILKTKATCDAEGNVFAKGKQVPKVKIELVQPEKEEPATINEPEKTKDLDDWMGGDDWGTSTKDTVKKKGKTVKEMVKEKEVDPVKDLLDSINNPDSTWGDPWASTTTTKKSKRNSVGATSTVEDTKSSVSITKSAVSKTSSKGKAKGMDWDAWDTPSTSKDKKKKDKKQEEETPKVETKDDDWGDSFATWGSTTKKDKKSATPKTDDSDPIDDSKIMKAAGVEESKSDDKDDISGFAFLNKKDKKKKASKNVPVEVVDDLLDVPLHESANVEETKSNAEEDPDWAFASNRVKAKKGKKGAAASKDDDPVARAPSPPEDDVKSIKAIEAAPADKKSKKSKKAVKTEEVDLSRSITKESTKSKASDKSKNLIDVEESEDDDDLAPDDSASVTKEPREPPAEDTSKAKKEEKKSTWGGMFSRAPPKPTLAQLRKEREERERKDKEERDSQEQQDREEKERLERERVEEERLEQERLEQEEREKALEEAAKAKKEEDDLYAATTKKGKKGAKKAGKAKAVEVAPPPPPPPPPPPVEPAAEISDDEESSKDDPFAGWGSKGKSSTKKATKKDLANEKSSLSKPSAKKVPEEEDSLPAPPITNTLKSSSASATKGIKSSLSTTKPVVTTGLSVAERIKALKGETKLKESAAQTPPVPPPPPPAPPVEAKIEAKLSKNKEIDIAVESSSKKLSKKQTIATKAAAAKLAAKKKIPEPEPEPEPVVLKRSKSKTPGGFPDSDESSDSSEDEPDEEPLIDLAPPTPPPEPEMGAKAATKSTKKSALDKKSAKTTKATPKSAKAAKAVAKKAIIDTSTESESETEAEQEKATANAEGTQGSGSTTAVDDSQATDRKLPTPPPEAKATSPVKKERAKVVRSGGSAWGFWGVSTPKQIRDRTKEATSTPLKGTSKPPMMVRPRPARKESVAVSVAASGAESEKKVSPPKPTPKRAPTFSLFGPTPAPRRKSVRAAATPKSSSRPQSRRVSPARTDGKETENDEEVLRVSSKAAKVMGISASGGPSAGRRASVKSKGVPDPYAIDDEPVMVDNGLENYAESSPVASKSKRKSVAEATSSTQDEGVLVDVDASEETRGAAADSQDPAPGTRSRKPSPVKRRSQSRTNPRSSSGGIMGLFSGLSRSKTVKEPRSSDPTFSSSRSKRDGYGSDDGSGIKSKRAAAAYEDASEPRNHRRRKSRRDVDEEGFTTDAPGVTTDYEEADRQRAERRAARRAEEKRNAEDARANEERAARRRERDIEKERDREARRAARAEQIRQEEEARRREDKEARRAARRAREEERIRQEEQARLDEQERIAKEERRARRREQRESQRDRDLPRESEREDRPRGDRRRSSYVDDEPRRSSKRTPGDRASRRVSRADPIENYFDPRNAGQSSQATPYLGSDKDKTSSWVESLSKENPLPIPPEDTATVIEPVPGEEPHSTDEEEVRRKMQQRSRRRESYRESGAPRESGRDRDRPRDSEGRRERRRRDRGTETAGIKSSESGNEKEKRRRSTYQDLPEDVPRMSRRNTYQDYGTTGDERPSQTKRASWFKKIF